jgi:hypothetical protein
VQNPQFFRKISSKDCSLWAYRQFKFSSERCGRCKGIKNQKKKRRHITPAKTAVYGHTGNSNLAARDVEGARASRTKKKEKAHYRA